ncbi:hypothetical protein PIIN_11192 [Serendipita indica DSM 11827]|uniref:Uncharacterized protein n=1 Tax=Serendipita indica (strain DSM 11827) TaxID=1109443 RepID=G4U0W7_SERID|nr:hypothetical protein PIIN_11192 [Serendipita indica DSM 11827]
MSARKPTTPSRSNTFNLASKSTHR